VEHGDLRENSEYKSALERQQFVQARLNHLTRRRAELSNIDLSEIPADRVGFGSRVTVTDLRTGDEETYTLVFGDYIDIDTGQISMASPLGQTLLGKKVGEEVSLQLPRGERKLGSRADHAATRWWTATLSSRAPRRGHRTAPESVAGARVHGGSCLRPHRRSPQRGVVPPDLVDLGAQDGDHLPDEAEAEEHEADRLQEEDEGEERPDSRRAASSRRRAGRWRPARRGIPSTIRIEPGAAEELHRLLAELQVEPDDQQVPDADQDPPPPGVLRVPAWRGKSSMSISVTV
jgi:transcription elongation factor GreA